MKLRMIRSVRFLSHGGLHACLAYLALFVLGASVHAQLSWNTRQLDSHPTAEDTDVQGDFEFFNSGSVPVTILDVKTSCGCTTAALDKKTYAPGEKGKVSAVFHIGERQGLQQKQIIVTTDNHEEPMVQLTLRTFIPELLRMEPRAVLWQVNSQNLPRTVRLSAGTDQPIKILGVYSSDDRFFAQLKQIEPGRTYDVVISVASTTEPLRGMIRIETDYPASRPKIFNLNVEIQTPFAPRPPQNPIGQPAAPGAVSGTGFPAAYPSTMFQTPAQGPNSIAPAGSAVPRYAKPGTAIAVPPNAIAVPPNFASQSVAGRPLPTIPPSLRMAQQPSTPPPLRTDRPQLVSPRPPAIISSKTEASASQLPVPPPIPAAVPSTSPTQQPVQ